MLLSGTVHKVELHAAAPHIGACRELPASGARGELPSHLVKWKQTNPPPRICPPAHTAHSRSTLHLTGGCDTLAGPFGWRAGRPCKNLHGTAGQAAHSRKQPHCQ